MLWGLALATFIAVFLGGVLAIRLVKHLHLILGFGAGAILGVAFFDLIPESIEIASASYDLFTITSVMALGFVGFMILDRVFLVHGHHHDAGGGHTHRGSVGAASLAAHTFMDGLAVGLAFQVSASLGVVVAVAVLAHSFADGINVVSMILKNGGEKVNAYRWLFVDAVMPGLGMFAAFFISIEEASLGMMLALFTGFFLYIGASDLLPESYHSHPKWLTTAMTVLGMTLIFVVVKVAGV